MTKKETKKTKENSKLFMEFSLNASYLQDVKISTDHEQLVDKKYFTDQLTDISNSVNDLEKVKSGDKVLTMAKRFADRLGKIKEVNPVNNLDTLRKAGMKELRISIKENDKGGYLQFGKSQKESWNSLLARVSKIGTVLLHKKDIFTVEKNSKGKLQVFTKDKYINPEVLMYTDDKKAGEWVANPKPEKPVTVSGDAMERIYSYEILGNFKSKVRDSEVTKGKTPKGSESESDGGATATTASTDFEMLSTALHFMTTKDPVKFAELTVETRFDKIKGNEKIDPSIILLERKKLIAIIDWLKIYTQALVDKNHGRYASKEDKTQEALKETLQDITELGIGGLSSKLFEIKKQA